MLSGQTGRMSSYRDLLAMVVIINTLGRQIYANLVDVHESL